MTMFWTGCSWSQIIAVLIVSFTIYITYMIWIRRKYPPGPWPLPFIGNLHLLVGNMHIDLKNLSAKYGPIYTLWMGWTPTVVVCSPAHGKEVLQTKGKDFAGRALESYLVLSVGKGYENVTFRPYDEKLKLLRRAGFSFMKAETTYGVSVQRTIEKEVEEFLISLKKMEGIVFDPLSVVTLSNINILMQIIISQRFKDVSDPKFKTWMELLELIMKISQNIVDSFPKIARILPWTRKAVNDASTKIHQFIDEILSEHDSTYEHGKVRDLFDVLMKLQKEPPGDGTSPIQFTTTDYALFLIDFAIGGAEQSILWAITVLLRRPDIQRKLQKELDNYISTEKKVQKGDKTGPRVLLTLADKPHLPYLSAFIYEVLRRCAVLPLTFPHKSLKNTSISTYQIPKDTAVLVNIYAIHLSDDDWEDPDIFNPERFLDSKERLDLNSIKRLMTFGAGPRNCVGQNLIKMVLFVYLANLLLNFEISCPSKDSIPLFDDGIQRFVFCPKPFSIRVKERRH